MTLPKAAIMIVVLAALAPSPWAATVPVYRATLVGPAGGDYVYAQAIKSQDDVTGCIGLQAFIRPDSTIRHLGGVDGPDSCGNGIVAMQDVAADGGKQGVGLAINDRDQITGEMSFPGSSSSHAFLYSDGVMTDIGTLGGGRSSGYGINNDAQVVGTASTSTGSSHAFLYTGERMYDLNSVVISGLARRTLTAAVSISDQGQILARSCLPGVFEVAPIACKTFRLDPVVLSSDASTLPQQLIVTLVILWFLSAASYIARSEWPI